MTKLNLLLCQDCLRAVPLHQASSNNGFCTCGGDTCGCSSCLHTLDLLSQGEKDPKVLGIQSNVFFQSWTPENGVQGLTPSGEPCADSLPASPDSITPCVSVSENKAGQGVN
jgi:hypothetical protein